MGVDFDRCQNLRSVGLKERFKDGKPDRAQLQQALSRFVMRAALRGNVGCHKEKIKKWMGWYVRRLETLLLHRYDERIGREDDEVYGGEEKDGCPGHTLDPGTCSRTVSHWDGKTYEIRFSNGFFWTKRPLNPQQID